MKTLLTTALLLLLAGAELELFAGAEPVLFICGPRCASGPNCPREAFVISIDTEENIQHAREIIKDGTSASRNRVFCAIIAGADGTNRNYLAAGTPLWNWHLEFSTFGSITAGDDRLTPSAVEGDVADGSFQASWDGGISTIMAELNPRFTASVRRASDSALTLEWDNLGLYYAFTVEWRTTEAESSWKPVPGISWPVRGTSHALPTEALSSGQVFLRVRADLVGP